MKQLIAKLLFSTMFLRSGQAHFKNKEMFLRIVPSYLPFKEAIVKYSGIAEFVLSAYILLGKNRNRVRKIVSGFLWLVFPANIYAARKKISYADSERKTVKEHVIRLPLQFVFAFLTKFL
ncbi:hypothetical protein HIP83_00720 [Staphylococcus coagulans]|uniref:DoxX family protein n=1 Tax=Staphylococcus coagulans TaxID=74706 RepID=UPI001BE58F43|nr:hypothetical protein [Staphylococcus coagulans]MBT2831655.1 hypothetical protein [Staphylococcus coagulans]